MTLYRVSTITKTGYTFSEIVEDFKQSDELYSLCSNLTETFMVTEWRMVDIAKGTWRLERKYTAPEPASGYSWKHLAVDATGVSFAVGVWIGCKHFMAPDALSSFNALIASGVVGYVAGKLTRWLTKKYL